MQEMGWERVTEDGEDVLLLPGAAKLSMTEARWIQDRKEQVDKEMRDAFRLGKSRSASTCTLASQATTEPAG